MRTGDASLKRIHNQRITAATADVSTEPRMWRRDGKRLYFHLPQTGTDASESELVDKELQKRHFC